MKQRREFLRTAIAGSVVLIAGCAGTNEDEPESGSGGSLAEETTTVSMTSSQFEPRNIHVETGATVTWQNGASADHTVTSASANWEQDAVVSSGEETTYTFEESGVYEVYCSYHGSADLTGMSMKVGVGDATIEDPLTESSDDAGVY